MKKVKLTLLCLLAMVSLFSCQESNKKGPEEEKAEPLKLQRKKEMLNEQDHLNMEPKNIVEKVFAIDSLSAFADVLKRTRLLKSLKEGGRNYTVFAPINAAFDKLEEGGTGIEDKDLEQILEYHVIKNKVSLNVLSRLIKENDGEYILKTIGGGELIAAKEKNHIVIKDAGGNTLIILRPDIEASNGVIHIIDGVAMSKQE